MIRTASLTVALLLTAMPSLAAAPAPSIAAAVADPGRPAADRDRDPERKPAEMLAFAGVKPGMVVVDILPGGGYFTRLFSTAVGPTGKVIGYVPDEMYAGRPKSLDAVQALAADPAHKNVEALHDPALAPGPANIADLVWTSQNYHDLHNIAGLDVVAFNKVLYRIVRPGGVYVVLDHSAPAGSGVTDTNTLHRIEAAAVRKEVEAAGFKFDGESKVLANPADPRTAKVFDPSIRGHTDQFILRFRKPGGK
ncbi:class I SAM-dependent methyltransferase [Sphingomonas crusticola]|uniref:class I SAM-dependent methyltransferase n=1 Tax=Sphingomonas crusticola TaxID=1697973 RepID=UPI0013C363FB|nr:class I SAM-dependent methyltransferase [Sphingomonas crusticola]